MPRKTLARLRAELDIANETIEELKADIKVLKCENDEMNEQLDAVALIVGAGNNEEDEEEEDEQGKGDKKG